MAVTMQALPGFRQVYENVLGDYVERIVERSHNQTYPRKGDMIRGIAA
jgi:hypothetical protein